MRNYRAATTFYMCHTDMNPTMAHQAISLALVFLITLRLFKRVACSDTSPTFPGLGITH